MVGAGETYLVAFALAVGLGEVAAGLISSFPLLVGGLLQAVSPLAIRRIGSEKRWVVLCASLQAAAFIPLVVASLVGSISALGLFLIASLYWACGLATGPAWNTWIDAVVPRRVRPRYFAQRTRLSQLATLGGFIGGGLLLQATSASDATLTGFVFLFLFAAIARSISVACLAMHRTPAPRVRGGSPLAPPHLASIAPSGRQLLAYLVVVQAAVQISGPYFAPYMLKQLELSYAQYMAVIAVAFAAKVLALPLWATAAKNRGAGWLLAVGGFGIVPLSALWIVSTRIDWLILIHVLSGALWAAYELGFFLLFFETLPLPKRTTMLTVYNLANSVAWFVGASIGGALLSYYGPSPWAYYLLFGVSSVGRLLALGLLVHAFPVRVPVRSIGLRVLGVRPASASLDAPILPSIPARAEPRRSTGFTPSTGFSAPVPGAPIAADLGIAAEVSAVK